MGARGPVGQGAARARLTGAYRPDRHDGQTAPPIFPGVPKCPRSLKGDARKWWADSVPDLIVAGVVSRAHTKALSRVALLWQLSGDAIAQYVKSPTPANGRQARAWIEAYDRAAARFGLTPRDQQAVRVPPLAADPEEDEFDRFLNDPIVTGKPYRPPKDRRDPETGKRTHYADGTPIPKFLQQYQCG